MYTPPLYHWPPKSLWVQSHSNKRTWNSFSVYFHFPFCRNLCDFCAYETRLISKSSVRAFSSAMIAQLKGYAETDDFSNSHLKSVFFGGGTASLMPNELIASLLEVLQSCSRSLKVPEVTLECEPGTINRARIHQARIHGINRVSVCAQSFNDGVLNTIGRKHTSQQSMRLIDDAISAGIQNIHLDLMYGLPGQSQQDWEQTLKIASSLPINHISTYKLYVFKHGALHRQGYSPGVEESATETEKMRVMHESSQDILGSAGFEQYTLTEYARTGASSDYIMNCFDGGDVLPIGPSAFGRCGNELWENSPFVQSYVSQLEDRSPRAHRLNSVEAFKRDVILGLWLLRIDLEQTAAKNFVTIRPELVKLLDELCKIGAVEYTGSSLSLAKHHRFEAGEVMRRLADLSITHWATAESDSVKYQYTDTENYTSAGSYVQRLGSIIRMTRLDKNLFNALQADPDATLQNLGYDVFKPEVQALIKVIRGKQNTYSNPDITELLHIWSLTTKEHVCA